MCGTRSHVVGDGFVHGFFLLGLGLGLNDFFGMRSERHGDVFAYATRGDKGRTGASESDPAMTFAEQALQKRLVDRDLEIAPVARKFRVDVEPHPVFGYDRKRGVIPRR